MNQLNCISDPRLEDESFLAATLNFVRRCPARSDYIELCFATDEGLWKWCFPEPPEQQVRTGGTLAVTIAAIIAIMARLFVPSGRPGRLHTSP